MQITTDDLLAGSYTILGEARQEPYKGQLAVAYVIVNRLNRPNYFRRGSIFDVCHAPLQFSMWNNSPDKNLEIVMATPVSSMPFMVALNAMLSAITGTTPDPTLGADHYHTVAKPGYADVWPPAWAKRSKKTAVIGAHVFYKLADE